MSVTQADSSPGTASRVVYLAPAAGWVLIALGLTVIVGWIFHVFNLTSAVAEWTAMKVNSAAAFLLSGVALLRRDRRDSLLYPLAVLAIGTATLVEYLTNFDFRIDQLLASDPTSAVDPGRMSQITSVGLVLLGPALALMNSPSEARRRISRGLGFATGAIGVIALLGHSYDTRVLYQMRPHSGIAVDSALAFVIAAIGVQCVNPEEGIVRQIRSSGAGGAMLRELLPSALLIPYVLGLIAWILHKHLGWEMGFSLALVIAATMACLAFVMLLNAKRLERQDLARREINAALVQRTASLQAREELLKAFVKHVPAAVAMLDRDMRYLQVSDRWCNDYSLAPSQILGRSHYEVFPDIPERWKEFHRRGLAGETLRADEDRWERGEGNTTWLHWEIRPWGNINKLPEGLLIFSEDITKRKQAESALRSREQQLRILTGNLLTAQEDERRRLSRELHDDVTQRLAFLSIELGKLASDIPESLHDTQDTIRALQHQTSQVSAEVRRLSHGLHPSVIEDFGLSIALEEFCADVEKTQGIRVEFEGLVDASRLDNATATCLYRITQESLRNAVVHGRATEIRVSLSVGAEAVELRVRDNGLGFAAESVRSKGGLGMVSMRERIRLVGGTVSHFSQPGQGAEIVASVPLSEVLHE